MPSKLILTIALSCALCLSAQAQNSSKYLKTLGQEGYTLYFIKPVNFKKSGARLIPDFTFQDGEEATKMVEIKFSLFSKTPFRELDYLSFHAGGQLLGQSSGSELMFLEKSGRHWHARFITKAPYSTMLEMLKAGRALEIHFHSQDTAIAFPANKKWEKASVVVKEILLAEVGREK